MIDQNKRVEYIDIAKGIGIILVVFGHVVRNNTYPMPGALFFDEFIYSFHMPLFFVISGLCIKKSKQISKETINKMATAYLIPYAIWTILYMLAFLLVEKVIGPDAAMVNRIAHAVSICGLAPLWFLLALFMAEVAVIALKERISTKGGYCVTLITLVVLTIISSIWYTNSAEGINLYIRNWLMGTFRLFPTIFFVLIGYFARDQIHRITELKIWIRAFLMAVMFAIQIGLCLRWNGHLDLQVYIIPNPVLYFIKALNGTMIVLMISQIIHSKLVVFLGTKTKELMILHYRKRKIIRCHDGK